MMQPASGWVAAHGLLRIATSLLLTGPLLILLGALLPPTKSRPFQFGALLLIATGTAVLFVTPQEAQLWGQQASFHSLAETRALFTGLVVLYLGVLSIPRLLHQRNSRLLSTLLPLSFLVLYSAGAVFLVSTMNDSAFIPSVNPAGAATPDPQLPAGPAE